MWHFWAAIISATLKDHRTFSYRRVTGKVRGMEFSHRQEKDFIYRADLMRERKTEGKLCFGSQGVSLPDRVIVLRLPSHLPIQSWKSSLRLHTLLWPLKALQESMPLWEQRVNAAKWKSRLAHASDSLLSISSPSCLKHCNLYVSLHYYA